MIDAPTRARWRRLFDEATVAPWVNVFHDVTEIGHVPAVEPVSSALYKRPIMLATAGADARFCCEARTGWPLALAELVAVEAERDAVKVAIEHAENAHTQSLRDALERSAALGADLDKLTATIAGLNEATDGAIARHDQMFAEVQRLRPLAEAVRAFIKHRYTPVITEAWKVYLECTTPSK